MKRDPILGTTLQGNSKASQNTGIVKRDPILGTTLQGKSQAVRNTGIVKIPKINTHTRIVPFFLFTGTGLETYSVRGTGEIKPFLESFSTSTLMATDFFGLTGRSFCQTGLV
jgi:hypothetical protein